MNSGRESSLGWTWSSLLLERSGREGESLSTTSSFTYNRPISPLPLGSRPNRDPTSNHHNHQPVLPNGHAQPLLPPLTTPCFSRRTRSFLSPNRRRLPAISKTTSRRPSSYVGTSGRLAGQHSRKLIHGVIGFISNQSPAEAESFQSRSEDSTPRRVGVKAFFPGTKSCEGSDSGPLLIQRHWIARRRHILTSHLCTSLNTLYCLNSPDSATTS